MRVGGRTSNASTSALCCNHRLAATHGASAATSQPCLSVCCLLRLTTICFVPPSFTFPPCGAVLCHVSKLTQEALTALHTTIPILPQHRDFRALLVDVDLGPKTRWSASPPSTPSLLSRSPRNPSLARCKPARAGSTLTPPILLESVSRRRLIGLGTLGMSDTFPTFLHNLLFLSLNTFARRSRSQGCASRSCLQN